MRGLANKGFQALLMTQFLEAFNDNAFKIVVSFLVIDLSVNQQSGTWYLALSGIVFVLPF